MGTRFTEEEWGGGGIFLAALLQGTRLMEEECVWGGERGGADIFLSVLLQGIRLT